MRPESTTALGPSSGTETPTLEWKFKVKESGFGDAKSSDHFIYRTLAAPTARYLTVVDIACNGISANTAKASIGVSTIGAFRLNDVLTTAGIPVLLRTSSITS